MLESRIEDIWQVVIAMLQVWSMQIEDALTLSMCLHKPAVLQGGGAFGHVLAGWV